MHPLPGCPWYFRYNFIIAWATRTIYASKYVQMDPQQLPNMSKFHFICKKFVMQKNVWGGVDTTPLVAGGLTEH